MDNKDIKIVIDSNGNILREVVDRAKTEDRKPKLLRRLVNNLSL